MFRTENAVTCNIHHAITHGRTYKYSRRSHYKHPPNDAAREPIAEFKKFTASLLTPTDRSKNRKNEQKNDNTQK